MAATLCISTLTWHPGWPIRPALSTCPTPACRWKATGDHRYDYAVVVTKQTIGKDMGYFDIQDPQQLLGSWQDTAAQQAGQLGQQAAVPAAKQRSSPTPAAAAAGVVLNIAGYPDDKPNGTLWYDHCGVLDWSFAAGAYMVHGCAARGGNSGSPLWLYDSRDGSRRAVGLHVAGQEVQGRQGAREVHLAVPFTGEAMLWVKDAMARNTC
jgi:V8-like Glu-specific endopeptidase